MSSSESDRDHRHKKSKRRRSRSLSSRSGHRHRRSKHSRERTVDRSRSSRERTRRRSRERHRERDSRNRYHSGSRSKGDSSRHRKRSPSSQSSSSSSSRSGTRHKSSSKSEAISRNKERIQAALKAAVSSDDTLKLNRKAEEVSLGDQIKRAAAIEEIDSAGFVQSEFKSNRAEIPLPKENQMDVAHSKAMFATSKAVPSILRASKRIFDPNDPLNLISPNLAVTVADKMDRWKNKLQSLREKQLKRRFS